MASNSFEVDSALETIARGLRQARLLRGDTQQTAAARIRTSLATYKRLESGDIGAMSAIASAVMLEALCAYGHANDVMALGDPARDTRSQELLNRQLPKNGRSPKQRPPKPQAPFE